MPTGGDPDALLSPVTACASTPDCPTCSRHQAALKVERADLLRAAAAAKRGRLNPDAVRVYTARVNAARHALEDHQADCEATP